MACPLVPLVVSDLPLEADLARAEGAGRTAGGARLVDVSGDDAQFGERIRQRFVLPRGGGIVQMARPSDFGPGEGLPSRPVFDGETQSERREIDPVAGDMRSHVGSRYGRSVVVENSQAGPRG
jgi:hypothetical protein